MRSVLIVHYELTMTMPLRRSTRAKPLARDEQLFSYWDDDGIWVDYCQFTNDLLNACKQVGRSQTAIYVGSIGYDICLDSTIQYNRDTNRPRPISAKGVASCDDDTVPLKIDEMTTPTMVCQRSTSVPSPSQ